MTLVVRLDQDGSAILVDPKTDETKAVGRLEVPGVSFVQTGAQFIAPIQFVGYASAKDGD